MNGGRWSPKLLENYIRMLIGGDIWTVLADLFNSQHQSDQNAKLFLSFFWRSQLWLYKMNTGEKSDHQSVDLK